MNNSYLYIAPNLRSVGSFADPQLETFTERHDFKLATLPLKVASSVRQEITAGNFSGIVLGLTTGLASRKQMATAAYALRHSRKVYFYWPAENAIEVIDRERLASFRLHWSLYMAGIVSMKLFRELRKLLNKMRAVVNNTRSYRTSRVAQTIEADAPPAIMLQLQQAVQFAEVDYNATRQHLIGGISLTRLVRQSFDLLDAQFRDFEQRFTSSGAEPALQKEFAKLSESCRMLASSMGALQSHMDGGESALNRLQALLQDLSRITGERAALVSAAPSAEINTDLSAVDDYRETLADFEAEGTVPVALGNSGSNSPLTGTGIYLRTDYWVQLISGGSYGHTCYVAKELASYSERFKCVLGSRFELLDDLGVEQEVVRPPLITATEIDWMKADTFYYEHLKDRFTADRPAFIYERLCLGNFSAARLSKELGIPYILEYNGSEISMRRSFGSGAFEHEDLLLKAEELAFRQATVINVISEHVRNDVVRRGIDPEKVLINPNGVDPVEYSPGSLEERGEIRRSLGFSDSARVIAFIGTFGGWHGIEVLAAAMPDICRVSSDVRFLLIGDGHLKHLVLDAVRKHGLEAQVVDVGRTEQRTGARLLKAADIFVSPHSSNMSDGPFFGSPTKLFEYMALEGGIVASDLEQLGQVMSPSLRPSDLAKAIIEVGQNRGVLCRPGDVADFVAGVTGLIHHPEVASALGRNARAAVLAEYVWSRHVERIWEHAVALTDSRSETPRRSTR